MKQLILLAPAALFLVSAQPPAGDRPRDGELNSVNAASAPAARPAPAVKAAPRAAPAPVGETRGARAAYPRCSATVTDRCIQGRGTATYRAAARPAPRRQQYAMRAGERG